MAVLTLGLFSNTIQGIEGAILLALAHGCVSPALFICVGGVLYNRTGTRNIFYLRGLVTYMPVFTILFFISILANTGIPLTLNWLGEQLSLIGIWERSPLVATLGATGIVFSAIYSIYLYNRISYGVFSPYLEEISDINRMEFHLLIILIFVTFLLGIFPNIILDTLHVSVSTFLYNIPEISSLNPLSVSDNTLVNVNSSIAQVSVGLIDSFILFPVLFSQNSLQSFHSLSKGVDVRDLVKDTDFYEWLRGFTDAEGSFSINNGAKSKNYFGFSYRLTLHRDDYPLLVYICKRLGIGTVYPLILTADTKAVTFKISNPADILKLIAIFDKYPLNTTKYFDYLDWRKAFFLSREKAGSNQIAAENRRDAILFLKNNMNKNRTLFSEGTGYKIVITPYWLLGFIEGDGSFSMEKVKFRHHFSLVQTSIQKPILEAIVVFLNKLKSNELQSLNIEAVHLSSLPALNSSKPKTTITIRNFKYIVNCLIPFFNKLTFFSPSPQAGEGQG